LRVGWTRERRSGAQDPRDQDHRDQDQRDQDQDPRDQDQETRVLVELQTQTEFVCLFVELPVARELTASYLLPVTSGEVGLEPQVCCLQERRTGEDENPLERLTWLTRPDAKLQC